MTVEEAIKELKRQHVALTMETGIPVSTDTNIALSMAISALEKEKEQALQEAKTSSKSNTSIKNDNTKLKECQEFVDAVVTKLINYYKDHLSGEEQKAWELYKKVLDAQNLLEEETQCQ